MGAAHPPALAPTPQTKLPMTQGRELAKGPQEVWGGGSSQSWWEVLPGQGHEVLPSRLFLPGAQEPGAEAGPALHLLCLGTGVLGPPRVGINSTGEQEPPFCSCRRNKQL